MTIRLSVIDSGVEEIAQHLSGDDLQRIALITDSGFDFCGQIIAALERVGTVSVIDIYAHAIPGCLQLAGGRYGADEVATDALAWERIGQKIEPTGAIHLYACQAGAGSAGTMFLDGLHASSQRSVAAATDLVGSAELGGGWILEIGRAHV